MTRTTITGAFSLMLIVLTGCGTGKSQKDDAPEISTVQTDSTVPEPGSSAPAPETSPDEEVRTYHGFGLVKNITPSRTYIIIEHHEIEGYMGAMTMPFEIRNESLLTGISVGDQVRFTLSVTPSSIFVSVLEKADG